MCKNVIDFYIVNGRLILFIVSIHSLGTFLFIVIIILYFLLCIHKSKTKLQATFSMVNFWMNCNLLKKGALTGNNKLNGKVNNFCFILCCKYFFLFLFKKNVLWTIKAILWNAVNFMKTFNVLSIRKSPLIFK